MLKIVLIDDESKALQSLEYEILELNEPVEIIGKFTDVHQALDFLENNEVDCVFLDIEMPNMDGFKFLDNFEKRNFQVVITTAYEQYAIPAIKKSAVDYLLKPVDSDDVKITIDKIIEIKKSKTGTDILQEFIQNINVPAPKQEKKIGISVDGKIIFLMHDEIIYCESDGNYCSIYLVGNKRLFVTKKLKDIEQILPPEYFYRIHHSYIINIEKVREYLRTDGYVILDENKRIPVSRQKRISFLAKI